MLVWHVTLQFDLIYTFFFCGAMGGLHFYKGKGLLFPPKVWAIELVTLIMFFIAQMIRIYIGFNANKWQSFSNSISFFLLTLGTILCDFYFGFMTTYILKIEILLAMILVAF